MCWAGCVAATTIQTCLFCWWTSGRQPSMYSPLRACCKGLRLCSWAWRTGTNPLRALGSDPCLRLPRTSASHPRGVFLPSLGAICRVMTLSGLTTTTPCLSTGCAPAKPPSADHSAWPAPPLRTIAFRTVVSMLTRLFTTALSHPLSDGERASFMCCQRHAPLLPFSALRPLWCRKELETWACRRSPTKCQPPSSVKSLGSGR